MSQSATIVGFILSATVFWVFCALLSVAQTVCVDQKERRLQELVDRGHTKADAALQVTRQLQSILATAHLGILGTFIGWGWLIARFWSGVITESIRTWPAAAAIAVAIGWFALASCLFVALGLLLPRGLASQRPPELVITVATAFLHVIRPVLAPFVHATHLISRSLLRLSGKTSADELTGLYPPGEAGLLVLRSHRYGLLGAAQREVLSAFFDFQERSARDIVTPAQEMACVSSSMRVDEALEAVRHFGFTRYPVCEGTRERVIGVIHFRDLIDAVDANPRRFVTDEMQSVLFVSEHEPVSEVLRALYDRRAHMAIVRDEHENVLGLITIEDILREFFGEEADRPQKEEPIGTISSGTYEIDGRMIVQEVEEMLGVELSKAGLETIGSFLFGKLGRKAQEGDHLKVRGVRFDILEMEGPRIVRVRAERSRELPPDSVPSND